MRLAWLSDIHLNLLTRDELTAFITTLAKSDCDAFLITGDIAEARTLAVHLTILDRSLDRPIYFVLGNHDFYRSSVARVRTEVIRLMKESHYLRFLTESETVTLSPSSVLVGHDGWADGRFGDFLHSPVYMTDFKLVEDYYITAGTQATDRATMKIDILHTMWRLADEAAAHFRRVVPIALSKAEHVIVATHVPPYREVAQHGGPTSDDHFLPFFASRIVGDCLREIMADHPDKRMTVYCGHAHNRATIQILDNLLVECAGAEYGTPEIQNIITVD